MIIKSDYDLILWQIQKDLTGLQIEYGETYNSTYFGKLIEYDTWFQGDTTLLEYFYKIRKGTYSNYPINSSNKMFWETVNEESRKVHDPLPSEMSEVWPSIILSNGLAFSVDGQRHEDLEDIISENDLIRKLSKNITWSSALGGSYSKIDIINGEPVLRAINPLNAIHVGEGKRRIYFFWEFIEKENNIRYMKFEKRSLNVAGRLIVNTRLFEISKKGTEMKEVPLSTIEETDGLANMVMPGIDSHWAWYLPNRVGKEKYSVASFGTSDYEGIIDLFDLIDEATSIDGDEVRQSRTIFGIPEDFFETDSNGRKRKFDWRIKNYIKKKDDVENTLQNIDQFTPKLDAIDKRRKLVDIYSVKAIRNAGLSPYTLGYQDSGYDGSELRKEREALTLKTREAKIKEFKPFVENIINALADFKKLKYKEISVIIPKYIRPDQSEIIDTWGKAKQYGIASVDLAVRQIHEGNLSEDEIATEIERIKQQEIDINNKLNNQNTFVKNTQDTTKIKKVAK